MYLITTLIAESTADTVAEVVGIVGSSIGRSVGVVAYPARCDRIGTVGGGTELPFDDIALSLDWSGTQVPGGDLKQETPRSEVKNKNYYKLKSTSPSRLTAAHFNNIPYGYSHSWISKR